MIFGDALKLHPATTALIGLSLMLLTEVFARENILKEKSSRDTFRWFSALIMMATFLNKLGLIRWFADNIQSTIVGMGLSWVSARSILVLVYLYAHYFFANTTAHITAMFAAFYTAGISLGTPPMLFALIMAAASNIMMCVTHYATGTSPIIFGSGFVTLGRWWGAGCIVSVVNLIVWLTVGLVWWKVLNYW